MQNLANFPFISANIFDINGDRIFDPYTIIEIDGLSLGIVGLASTFNHPELYIKNPIKTINEIIPEVNNQSDILVLLFDSQESDLSQIQNIQSDIDLIIRSKSKIRSKDGGTKNIPAYSCGDRGKYLYQFDLAVVDPTQDFTDLALYQNQKSQAEKKLNKMKQGKLMVDLYSIYKDDPQSLKKIENFESQIKSANIALNNSINTISVTKHELGKTINDRPDIIKIVDKGKNKITKTFGPQPPPGTPKGNHRHIRHDHNGDGIPDH